MTVVNSPLAKLRVPEKTLDIIRSTVEWSRRASLRARGAEMSEAC